MTAPQSNPVVLPDDLSVVDSSLGNEVASSTESISSSILDYRRENGRTYHRYKEGKYSVPNDEMENERLDLQHHLFLITFGDRLGLAPPNLPESKPKRVLDIGTGTGIWAIDFADEHPESEVTGIDLSPIQPDFVPPNVRFVIDDMDEEWNYPHPFDYIHSRMMTMSVGNWKSYVKTIFENLAPGGYFEVQEIDVVVKSDDETLKPEYKLSEWCKLLNEACYKLGRPWVDFDEIPKIMEEVGFVNVVDSRFKWPSNRWPKDKKFKEIGTWANENIMAGLESVTLAPFTRAHGWSKEEVDVFLTSVRKDLNNPEIHAYWPICSISGQKPEA